MEESNVEETAINISEESTESQLSDKKLSFANNLFSIMRYLKGPNKEEIILPYLQRKVYNYFAQTKAQHFKSQKLKHISEIRSLHLDVLESYFNKLIDQAKKASIFGLMIDKSTRGQTKYLVLCYQFWYEKDQMPVVMVAQLQTIIKCNAEVVSDTVIIYILKSGLDIKKCVLWVTNNTSYLLGEKKGAISLFNKKTNTSSLWIDKLTEALDALSSKEFGLFFDNLEQEIVKALEYFRKWFLPWLYLPLSICHLGDLEIRFAKELEDDFKNGITNTFGL
ncbi:30574_t:CDS:2, partial [Gigaspora margarita]